MIKQYEQKFVQQSRSCGEQSLARDALKHLLELLLVLAEQLCGHSNGKYHRSSGDQCSSVLDHGCRWSDCLCEACALE
jgi:hypothetical protein